MVKNGKPTMIMPGVDRKKKAVESSKTSGKASKKESKNQRNCLCSLQ